MAQEIDFEIGSSPRCTDRIRTMSPKLVSCALLVCLCAMSARGDQTDPRLDALFAELHATDDDTDPLAEIIAKAPVKVLEDGTTEAHSCFDILSSLATAFNARVFLANGYVWFWPMNAYQRVADA